MQKARAEAADIHAEAQKKLSESEKKVMEGRIAQLQQQADKAAAHAVEEQTAAVAAEREAAAAAAQEADQRMSMLVTRNARNAGAVSTYKVGLSFLMCFPFFTVPLHWCSPFLIVAPLSTTH